MINTLLAAAVAAAGLAIPPPCGIDWHPCATNPAVDCATLALPVD